MQTKRFLQTLISALMTKFKPLIDYNCGVLQTLIGNEGYAICHSMPFIIVCKNDFVCKSLFMYIYTLGVLGHFFQYTFCLFSILIWQATDGRREAGTEADCIEMLC